MLTYDFRLPPGPRTVELALLAEELGFRAVWCPEIPAFGLASMRTHIGGQGISGFLDLPQTVSEELHQRPQARRRRA